MKSASLLACIALALTGACGNDTLQKMEKVKNRICECQDRACVAKLKKESRALEPEMKNLSEADLKKANALAMATMECATRDFSK
jgi:cell division protein FtsB